MSGGAIFALATSKRGFGDVVEEDFGLLDAPASNAGALEMSPAIPADASGRFNEYANVDDGAKRLMKGVDAFDDDGWVGMQSRDAFAAMRVKAPDGRFGGIAGAEVGDVLQKRGEVSVTRVVALALGHVGIVGQVIVGAEHAWGKFAREGAFAGAYGTGDADDERRWQVTGACEQMGGCFAKGNGGRL